MTGVQTCALPISEDNGKGAGVIDKASETISRRGVRVANFTIKPDSPDYQKLIDAGEIKSLPAILAIRKGHGSDIVTGEITEEKLLAGYLQASKPVSSISGPCCPQ